MRRTTITTLVLGFAIASAAPAFAQSGDASTVGSSTKPAASAAGETSPSKSGGGTKAHMSRKSGHKRGAMMAR